MTENISRSLLYPKVPGVGVSTWGKLYKQAVDFKNIEPWGYITEKDVFGVEIPGFEEKFFCQITGLKGQHKALSVYPGMKGLHFILDMLNGKMPLDPFLILKDCEKLEASFEDKKTLDRIDLEIIKKLKLKFRGKMSWPMFRDYKPGYLPWFIDEKGARILTRALQLSYLVGLNVFAAGDTIPMPLETGKVLIFKTPDQEDETKLTGSVMEIPEVPEEKQAEAPIDELRLKRLQKSITQRSNNWEVAGTFSEVAVSDPKRSRPFFPVILVWLDDMSEKPVHTVICRKDEINRSIVTGTIEAIEAAGFIPIKISAAMKSTYDLLAPLAAKMKFVLEMEENSQTMEGLLNFLRASVENPEVFGSLENQ